VEYPLFKVVSHTCFGYEGKTGGERFFLKKKINLLTTISMKRHRRELSIDIKFKNNPLTLFPCLTFMPKTGVSFYSGNFPPLVFH